MTEACVAQLGPLVIGVAEPLLTEESLAAQMAIAAAEVFTETI